MCLDLIDHILKDHPDCCVSLYIIHVLDQKWNHFFLFSFYEELLTDSLETIYTVIQHLNLYLCYIFKVCFFKVYIFKIDPSDKNLKFNAKYY